MAITPDIKAVNELISSIETVHYDGLLLFRGQNCSEPLLPKVARKNPKKNTCSMEREMLEELKRRKAQDPTLLGKDDWDCLVLTQHYGMATRLLDWTTNPLIALGSHLLILMKVAQDTFIYCLLIKRCYWTRKRTKTHFQ